jgi:O-acetylhomoserine (thiol)-lyase
LEVTSCTKYYSGGGTSIGGLIIDHGTYNWSDNPKTKPWTEKFHQNAFFAYVKKEVFRNTGGCIAPHNAYLQTLALETLTLRTDKTCDNALELAQWMAKDKRIKQVNYPGLSDSPWHQNAKKMFGGKFGGLLSVELEDDKACYQFLDKLKIIKRATNMNDNRSLIIHPWSTIYSEFSDEIKVNQSISKGLMRLSVGIEDIQDLKEDIDQALK